MGLKSGRLVVIFVIALAFTITAGYSQASDIGNLRDRAEAGDARSQRELGNSYLIGVGVPKDESQAAIWYRKAAEHGDAEAQFLLAMLYEQGRGVPKDAGQAAVWYQKSAAKGNTFAKQKVSELQQVQQAPVSKGIKYINAYVNPADIAQPTPPPPMPLASPIEVAPQPQAHASDAAASTDASSDASDTAATSRPRAAKAKKSKTGKTATQPEPAPSAEASQEEVAAKQPPEEPKKKNHHGDGWRSAFNFGLGVVSQMSTDPNAGANLQMAGATADAVLAAQQPDATEESAASDSSEPSPEAEP